MPKPTYESRLKKVFKTPTAWPAEYDDAFRHFDTLIWQVPAWGTAVFAGILAAFDSIAGRADPAVVEKTAGTSRESAVVLLLLGGALFMAVCSYTVLRWRTHQLYTRIANAPRAVRPLGAQTWLQLVLNGEAVALFYLFLVRVVTNHAAVTWAVTALAIATLAMEAQIWFRGDHAKALRQ